MISFLYDYLWLSFLNLSCDDLGWGHYVTSFPNMDSFLKAFFANSVLKSTFLRFELHNEHSKQRGAENMCLYKFGFEIWSFGAKFLVYIVLQFENFLVSYCEAPIRRKSRRYRFRHAADTGVRRVRARRGVGRTCLGRIRPSSRTRRRRHGPLLRHGGWRAVHSWDTTDGRRTDTVHSLNPNFS